MMDILDLVPILIPSKSIQNNTTSKQQYFNDLLIRLKERNTNNQNYIKRYIKKNKKKHSMFIFSNALRNQTKNYPQRIQVKQFDNSHSTFHPQYNPQKSSIQVVKQESIGINKLKATNISENQICGQVLKHNKTICTLRIRQIMHKSNKKLTEGTPNVHMQQTKCQKEFTRYLRSFFLNKIVEKSRLKERQKELQLKSNARSLYKGRVHTEIQKSICCQVKVKSLVFGSLQEKDGISKKYQGNIRVHTESYDNRYSRLQKNEKKLSKGILPTINTNISMKNRRCLQNYLRFHQQKVNKQKSQCFKITKIPIQTELVSATEAINRKTMLLKLNTLQLRKN